MAISNGSSLCKTEVYESLYLICQATQQITEHLDRLRNAKILGRISVEINKAIALHLRADIATSAAHNRAQPEIEEAYRQESKHIRMMRKQAQGRLKGTS